MTARFSMSGLVADAGCSEAVDHSAPSLHFRKLTPGAQRPLVLLWTAQLPEHTHICEWSPRFLSPQPQVYL